MTGAVFAVPPQKSSLRLKLKVCFRGVQLTYRASTTWSLKIFCTFSNNLKIRMSGNEKSSSPPPYNPSSLTITSLIYTACPYLATKIFSKLRTILWFRERIPRIANGIVELLGNLRFGTLHVFLANFRKVKINLHGYCILILFSVQH